jgi:hypothetical protein
MNDLQKIVVLCAIVLVGIGAYLLGTKEQQQERALTDSDTQEQINPPSLELETGPEDTTEEPLEIPLSNGCTQTMIDMPCADTYHPVCATLKVKCESEPCEPVKQTVNNSCEVCKLYNLVSFEAGACAEKPIPVPEPLPPSPKEEPGEITCSEELKKADGCYQVYDPVCALVQVTCIQAPCPPVKETYGNACEACSQGSVLTYTKGACNFD